MATLRDIKRRISSIGKTQQITRAMQMVAASRLKRAQETASSWRAYHQRAIPPFPGGGARHPRPGRRLRLLHLGLLHLLRTTFDVACEQAAALQEVMLKELWDETSGGFFLVGAENRELPVRPKEIYDGAVPSANSVALLNLLWLSRLTGNPAWEEKADRLVRAFAGSIGRQPSGFTFFLCGLDFALRPGQVIVIAGENGSPDADRLLSALNLKFSPNHVTQLKSGDNASRLARFAGYTNGLQVAQGKTAAHLCVGSACKESVTDVQGLIDRLLGKK